MNTQTHLRVIITLLFLLLISACGSSNSPNETAVDLGSLNTPNVTASKPLVTCNKMISSTLGYKTAAQKSGTSYDPNWLNVYLTQIPQGVEAGSTVIKFYKGLANSDSTLSFETNEIPFGIYNKNTSTYLVNPSNNSQIFTQFNWNELKTAISTAPTAAGFINQVIFVLNLQDSQSLYQVLSVRSFSVNATSPIDDLVSLIPTFYANPLDYSVKSNGIQRESVLKNMHPLKNQTGDFSTLATGLCL